MSITARHGKMKAVFNSWLIVSFVGTITTPIMTFALQHNLYHGRGMSKLNSVAGRISGGEQYIHNRNENTDRQEVLHQCFRQSSQDAFVMSGILKEAKRRKGNKNEFEIGNQYKVLEIGCGAGHTTLDLLSEIFDKDVHITGVDTDASMIDAAKARLKEQYPEAHTSKRVKFLHQSGESLADDAATNQFDAVWLRFVIVHVPDPEALLSAAMKCLKPGGILLVEDCYVAPGVQSSSICHPPVYAHAFFHDKHAQATLQLGGDLARGATMGEYFSNIGMHEIECNSFAPVFGRDINIWPWTSVRAENPPSKRLTSLQHYELGCTLFEQSMTALIPKLRQLEVCSEEEAEAAQESMRENFATQKQYDKPQKPHIFSLPGELIFQWWAKKPQ